MIRLTLISLWPDGGMLHYATALANALAAEPGLAVTLLLPNGADTSRLTAAVTPALVDLPLRRGAGQALHNALALARIDRFVRALRATRPDVVHLNSSHPWLIPSAGWLARTWPLVATVHDVEPHPGEDSLRRRLQSRAVLRHATVIAVHGDALQAQVLRRCPWRRPADVVVTPHGTYTFFGTDSGADDAGGGVAGAPDRPTVLFFGRILTYKGLDVLLREAPRVRQAIPDVRFVVAGEGDLEPYAAWLGDQGLVEIRSGYVAEDAVGALFRDASVLAVPYTEASWSGVASIAHAFGVPVVASRVGCLPEAVQDGVNGLLVPPGDVNSLAEALASVLAEGHFAVQLRRGARATQGVSWETAANLLCSVYQKVRR